MKKYKIAYWVSTSIVALMMVFAAWSYLTNSQVKQAFIHLGFPNYFRVELAIGKLAGAILLLVPFKTRIKEWVYAGFVIVFISAFIAHVSSGDPVSISIMPVIFLAVLLISYFSLSRISSNAIEHSERRAVAA